MRRAMLAAALSVAAAGAAMAAGSEADAVRRQAGVLERQARSLRVATDAPQLGAQLGDLNDALDAFARRDRSVAAEARRVRAASTALQTEIQKAKASGGPLGEKFCRDAAEKVEKISGEAAGLAGRGPVDSRSAPASAFAPADPQAEAALSKGLQTASSRIRARLAASARPNFDAVPAAARASVPAPASVPIPRPREFSRKAKPVYSGQVAGYQEALDAVRRAAKQGAIKVDGYFGSGTDRAVKDFQRRNGFAPTGVVDRETENALLSQYQKLKKLPLSGALDETTQAALPKARENSRARARAPVKGEFYSGPESDFAATPQQTVVKGALATIYTPYIARTRKQRKMEGPPVDKHEQPICTVERYLGGACPYVSVAIDPRLRVPNGTPLLIPEISDLVGKQVRFRIVDVGSPKKFHGTKHVDIATDSGDDRGLGSLISGLRFTLVLPQGLRP